MEVEKRTIESDGLTMTYFVSGKKDGAPVVLMHGWGCNHTTVQSIEAALAPAFRIYNVDFPGFGESPEPQEPCGVEAYSRVVEKLIKSEELDRPTLIGHSFGGRVGIIVGARNTISRLILVDAAGIKPRRSIGYYRKVYTYKFGKWLARTFMSEERAKKVIERCAAKAGSSDYQSASPMMRRIMSLVVNEDLCSHMPDIKAPTLLIWGENDTATPLSDAKRMNRLIQDSGLVSFPGCGHYSFLDNPVQFKAVLLSFMNS